MGPGSDLLGGGVVRLLEDHTNDGLEVGDAGYVWGACNFSPPSYEADFYRSDGTGIAMLFTTDEVELVDNSMSAYIPEDAHEFWR